MSFVSVAGFNDLDSDYSDNNLFCYVSASPNAKGTNRHRIDPTLFNYCLAARLFANQNNKIDIVNAIDQLMKQYEISTENPNGTKAES